MSNQELIKLFKNYKVFVDTCSLLCSGTEEIFISRILPILKKNKNKIIVPVKVIEELEYHSKKGNRELKKNANLALRILNLFKKELVIDIRGEKGDPFADNLLISVFTRFRLNYNLCLITQDYGLSEAILNLGKGSRAVDRNLKKIKIIRIFETDKEMILYTELKDIGLDIGLDKKGKSKKNKKSLF